MIRQDFLKCISHLFCQVLTTINADLSTNHRAAWPWELVSVGPFPLLSDPIELTEPTGSGVDHQLWTAVLRLMVWNAFAVRQTTTFLIFL